MVMRRIGTIALAFMALLAASVALAQSWPSKPVRLVVAYPPGGPSDVVARLYAAKLTESLGQPVVVENRAGANGNIASQLVAKAPPDGSTFLLHASSLVINTHLYKNPGYKLADFTPIAEVFDYKLIVVAHPSVPASSLKELVALAKAKPGQLTYASAGIGAPTHLSVELFKQRAGIDMIHVPYNGAAPAVTDLLGGHVMLMFNNPQGALPHIKAGKLRGLAVTGLERQAQVPDLPTVAELGYPGFDVGTWFAIWGPAGLPPAIVTTAADAIAKVFALPDVREAYATHGLNPVLRVGAELEIYQREESERWGQVIRAANITTD
jgi:tripartite-type tricarboxylate transporter receptor subunit TctC